MNYIYIYHAAVASYLQNYLCLAFLAKKIIGTWQSRNGRRGTEQHAQELYSHDRAYKRHLSSTFTTSLATAPTSNTHIKHTATPTTPHGTCHNMQHKKPRAHRPLGHDETRTQCRHIHAWVQYTTETEDDHTSLQFQPQPLPQPLSVAGAAADVAPSTSNEKRQQTDVASHRASPNNDGNPLRTLWRRGSRICAHVRTSARARA